MANEINVSATVTATKGNLSVSRTGQKQSDLGTARYAAGAMSLTTTEAAIPLGPVTTPGVSYFKNLDTTNYLEIGLRPSGTFYAAVKLLPSELAVLRLGTAAPYARAGAGTPLLDYTILET